MIDFEALKAPFPPDNISWRVGSISKKGDKCLPLAYLTSRDVMDRLDEVCGPENWKDEFTHIGPTTICRISIRVTPDEWVYKEDGAGTSDIEAEKGQLSDASKRCAVKWGIGRYLYDVKAPWVSIDEFKHILPSEMERLMALLPNADKTAAKVNGLQGISKTPAKFWDRPKLDLSADYPKDCVDLLDVWIYDKICKAINKAPTKLALTTLQIDNLHWIEKHVDKDSIMENFSIRASQFDGVK